MSEPVKLSSVSGLQMTNGEIADFIELWAHHIRESSRPLRTLTLIAESDAGEIGMVNSGKPIDKARLIGLMHVATDRVLNSDDEGHYKAGFLWEDIK